MTSPQTHHLEPDRDLTIRWTVAVAFLAAGSYLLARYIQLGPLSGPWAYWPINGLLCGVLFRRPVREWPFLAGASFGAQVLTILMVRGDVAGGATLLGALGGVVQAMLGAALLRRQSTDDSPLENPRVLAWFVAIAVTLVPLAITPFAAMAFSSGLDLPLDTAWWPLFVGNSLSMLLFAPLTMQRWQRRADREFWLSDTSEAVVCLALLAAMTFVAFDSTPSWLQYVTLPYAVFPLLAWAALRSGPRWTAVSIVMLTTIAAWHTARGNGPFAHPGASMAASVSQLEAYLAFVAFTGLLLSALTEQRRRSFTQTALDEAVRSAFFESSNALLVLKDIGGRYLMVNRAVEESHRTTRDQLIGRHPSEFMDEASARIVETHDRRVLDRGEPIIFEETLHDGHVERQFLMTRFPVRDASGAVRYLGMIGHDETVERDLSARLHRAQRVELIGQMAAGLAHDLNNILFVLVSDAALLREQQDRPAEELEILREMGEAGAQATRLTSRLLSMGRPMPVARTPVNVDASLREIEPLLGALVRGRIELVMSLDAADTLTITDPTAIEQIVLNLVANARDAIPVDGRVTLATQVVGGDGSGHAPAMLRLRVTDTGEGMDPSTAARVFEPFFTTKAATHGTGLGLYTTSLLVQQAGGTIRVASERGAGTTIEIDLPVHEPAG